VGTSRKEKKKREKVPKELKVKKRSNPEKSLMYPQGKMGNLKQSPKGKMGKSEP